MERKEFHPQDVIFSEGEPSDLAYLIVRGSVDIFVGRPPKRQRVSHAGTW